MRTYMVCVNSTAFNHMFYNAVYTYVTFVKNFYFIIEAILHFKFAPIIHIETISLIMSIPRNDNQKLCLPFHWLPRLY